MKAVTLKTIMTAAWTIAREAVSKFGGKAREFFTASLKMAWENTKMKTAEFNFSAIEGHPGFAQISNDIKAGIALADCGGEWMLDKDEVAAFLNDNPQHPEAQKREHIKKCNAMWKEMEKQGITSWSGSGRGKNSKNRYYLNGSRETGDEFESAFFEVETGRFDGNNDKIVNRLKTIIMPYLTLKNLIKAD